MPDAPASAASVLLSVGSNSPTVSSCRSATTTLPSDKAPNPRGRPSPLNSTVAVDPLTLHNVPELVPFWPLAS